MAKSLKTNSIWYLLYTIANIAFPLVVGIYVARVLTPETVGDVAYALNIVTYFVILSFLGIPTYGLREVAKVKDNQEELNKLYSELYIINFISTAVFSLLFVGLVFAVPKFKADLPLYLLTGIAIALNALNIDWLFEGVENFSIRAISNVLFKVASLVCLILFVKDDNHSLIYAVISVVGLYGNYVINFAMHRKFAKFTLKDLHFKRHVKPILLLVSVNIAIEIYSLLDITVIGIFRSSEHVAYYKYGHSIQKIFLQLINALTMVIVPRLSRMKKEGDTEGFNDLISKTFKIILILSIPIVIGLQFVSKYVIVAIYGESYAVSAYILMILSTMIIVSPVGYLLGSRVCLIEDKEKTMLFCVASGALVNLIGNFALVPSLGEYGAAIASIISEVVVAVVYIAFSHKYFKLKVNTWDYIKILVANLALAGFCLGMYFIGISSWLMVILTVFGAAFIYFLLLTITRESFVYAQVKGIFARFKKGK